jgi:hypothetical protein
MKLYGIIRLLPHLMPTIVCVVLAIYFGGPILLAIPSLWNVIIIHSYTSADFLFIISGVLSIIGFILMGGMMYSGFKK